MMKNQLFDLENGGVDLYMSKYGNIWCQNVLRKKKLAHKVQPSVLLDVSTFWCPLWPVTAQSHTMGNLFVFFICSFLIKKSKMLLMVMSLYVCPPIDHRQEPMKLHVSHNMSKHWQVTLSSIIANTKLAIEWEYDIPGCATYLASHSSYWGNHLWLAFWPWL